MKAFRPTFLQATAPPLRFSCSRCFVLLSHQTGDYLGNKQLDIGDRCNPPSALEWIEKVTPSFFAFVFKEAGRLTHSGEQEHFHFPDTTATTFSVFLKLYRFVIIPRRVQWSASITWFLSSFYFEFLRDIINMFLCTARPISFSVFDVTW